MKKRILALALAGTTAFSVFGSALSANAYYDSTHDKWDIDRYESYVPAGDLIWGTNSSNATVVTVNNVYYTGSDLNTWTDYDISKMTQDLYVLPKDPQDLTAVSSVVSKM